jgi:hypothetical protein
MSGTQYNLQNLPLAHAEQARISKRDRHDGRRARNNDSHQRRGTVRADPDSGIIAEWQGRVDGAREFPGGGDGNAIAEIVGIGSLTTEMMPVDVRAEIQVGVLVPAPE